MAMRVQNKTKKSTSGIRNTNRTTGAYSGDAYHDDGSDDEGAISLAAIKNKYKKGAAAMPSKGSYRIYCGVWYIPQHALDYSCVLHIGVHSVHTCVPDRDFFTESLVVPS